ncbi:MAG: hypothetical protein EA411_04185 [Saprospirales bacterium]|nr:MAG: hypothetical protein EA411_04185 [Saprospirales bacterium]
MNNYLLEDVVVTYWTALNLHGLTEQFPNTVFVQTIIKKAQLYFWGTLPVCQNSATKNDGAY